jgi:sulfotransferase family protein
MNLSGWVPARVAWRNSGPRVEWTLMGGRRLLEPFFEQTLNSQMTHPFHHLFRRETSLEEMVEWGDAHPSAPLRGIILHMSRCGSTLMSQMLASLERNIVASEPAPLDAVLRAHLLVPNLAPGIQARWLRAMAAALGQARAGEQAFYIKMDCWHVHQIDLIRDAFPNVPWIFLYRDPLEVMVSQKRSPAAWTVPGLLHPTVLLMDPRDWDPTQTDVYCARALAHICDAGLQAVRRHRHGLLVNYSELPQVMYGRLLAHFGLPEAGIPTMQHQSHTNPKSPETSFARDDKSKQTEATVRLREVVAEHLQPVYLRLEAERHAQARGSGMLITQPLDHHRVVVPGQSNPAQKRDTDIAAMLKIVDQA